VKHLKAGKHTILDVFDTETKTLASVVSGATTAKAVELEDIKLQQSDLLWTLPGNIELYRLEMIAGEGREFSLKRFIEASIIPENFDYLIIDTPPTPSIWMTSALIASDYYVIPVKPDPLSLIGIDLLRSIIERRRKTYGLTLECLGVVFTMVERSDSVNLATARSNLKGNNFWNGKVFNSYILKRTDLARQQLNQPYILKMDDYDLRNNLRKLVDEILGKI
jgi:chromosome partitioning protein